MFSQFFGTNSVRPSLTEAIAGWPAEQGLRGGVAEQDDQVEIHLHDQVLKPIHQGAVAVLGAQERALAQSLATRHGLSLSQVYLILDEGIRDKWPGPDGEPLIATTPPQDPRDTW